MSKERLEEHTHVAVKVDEYRFLKEQAKRVQELEREFELCDSTMHMIDMTINNPSTSDDDKWEKVNKTIKKYYADDCIHCNGKGFNGLDYCSNCVRGEVIQKNMELAQQNKRYRDRIEELEAKNWKYIEQNKRYREAIDYVMTAEVTQYRSLENALEDIKFVINETLESELDD